MELRIHKDYVNEIIEHLHIYQAGDYISMLGLKLNHVNKGDPGVNHEILKETTPNCVCIYPWLNTCDIPASVKQKR